MFVNRQTFDCSVNYQAHERNMQKEKPDEKNVAEYNPKDPSFAELV